MRDPDVIRYIRAEPLDRERALEQHERSLEEWELFGFGKRAIIEAETDQWLGFVELSRVGPGKGSRDDDIELGYFVEPSRWGEGIATEAAIATRDEAFDRCGIERADRPLPRRERRFRARPRQGRFSPPAALRARRRHRRRDPPDAAYPLDGPGQAPRAIDSAQGAARDRTTVKRANRLAIADPVDDETRRLRRRAARGQPEALHAPPRARPRRGVDDRGRRRAVDRRRRPLRRGRPFAADLHLRRVVLPGRGARAGPTRGVGAASVWCWPDAVPSPLRIERG